MYIYIYISPGIAHSLPKSVVFFHQKTGMLQETTDGGAILHQLHEGIAQDLGAISAGSFREEHRSSEKFW